MNSFICLKEDKDYYDLFLFCWLTAHYLPYSFMNQNEMKALMHELHPGYQMASVETLKTILK